MQKSYYAIQIVKGGPRCAVSVWYGQPDDPVTGEALDRSPRWQATIHGQPCDMKRVALNWDDYRPDRGCAIVGDLIDKAEHDYIVSLREWAIEHDPDAPEAAPRSKIDLNAIPSLF